jgi:hypothetical protein
VSAAAPPEARARRLVRCYPRRWRERYGEEFTLLLVDDIAERPRSWRRTADVVGSGLLARLTYAGLAGRALERTQQQRATLAAIGCLLAGFLILGTSVWSQLTIGWQWSAPAAPATEAGMLAMSAAMLVFAVLAVLAAAPLAWIALRTVLRGDARGVRVPALVSGGAAIAFIAAGRHFGHGWPGTGGHPWAEHGLVPSPVARFCWAATLWITSYWAHPGALTAFPAAELVWMAASPLLLLSALVGAAIALRRLPVPAAVVRYEIGLAIVAAGTMSVFLAGTASWVVSGGPAPRQLYRVGAIDAVALVAMAVALVLAFQVLQRALAARPSAPATG